MSTPDTLVVTATLGNRPTLSRTIKTVKEIGGKRVRHIIVAPRESCQSIRQRYPDLTVVEEPENCNGIYRALNHGLKMFASDFKYVTYINDDDYWTPGFKFLFDEIDRHNDVDVVYGRVNYVNSKGVVIGEQTSSPRYQDFGILLLKEVVLFTQQATLTKSQLFLKLEGFDESFKLVADTKFWLEAININSKFRYVNKICAGYTIQQGQLSSNKKLQQEEHERLILSNEIVNPFLVMIKILLFRLWNIKIYFKRFIN